MNSMSGLRTDHIVAAPHVVVVEEDDEQADVRTLGLALLVEERRESRGTGAVHLLGHRIDLDDREGVDRLRLAVFLDPELVLRQIDDRVALFIGDDRIDADVVDARPDARWSRLRILLLGL